jgi:FkbM family methyltransferase
MDSQHQPVFLPDWHPRSLAWRLTHTLKNLFIRFHWRGETRLRQLEKTLITNQYILYRYLKKYRIWICPNNTMDKDIVAYGTYEPEIQNIIRQFVEKGYSYIDVGANIGLHLIYAASMRQQSTQLFWGFEPEGAVYEVLKRNLINNRLHFINIFPFAVSDSDGTSQLYIASSTNQGLHSIFPRLNNLQSRVVRTQALDSYYYEFRDYPTLIKIDVEGAEPLVIKGAQKFFTTSSELVLIVELIQENLELSNSSVDEMMCTLFTAGFQLFSIGENLGLIDQSKSPGKGNNILAVRGHRSLAIAQLILETNQ